MIYVVCALIMISTVVHPQISFHDSVCIHADTGSFYIDGSSVQLSNVQDQTHKFSGIWEPNDQGLKLLGPKVPGIPIVGWITKGNEMYIALKNGNTNAQICLTNCEYAVKNRLCAKIAVLMESN